MLSLIVLQGPGKGRVFRFTGEKPVVLGRQSGDLRLLDKRVSRRHAEINFEGGTWIIRDLRSANGTYVNGRKIDQLTELEEGDQLAFGAFVLVIGQLTHDPPALGDTSLVDAESMDHVMLSPHVPTTDRAQADDEDDVMHVEPVPHAARPEAPPAEVEQDLSEASIFDVDADEPDEDDAEVEVVEQAAAEPEAVVEPEPEDVVEPEAIIEPEPEAVAEPKSIVEPEATVEPEPQAVAEPEQAPEPQAWVEDESLDTAEPEPAPLDLQALVSAEPESLQEQDQDDVADALATDEPDLDDIEDLLDEQEPQDQQAAEPEPETQAEPEPLAASSEPATEPDIQPAAPLTEAPYNLLGSLQENPFELFDAYVANEADARDTEAQPESLHDTDFESTLDELQAEHADAAAPIAPIKPVEQPEPVAAAPEVDDDLDEQPQDIDFVIGSQHEEHPATFDGHDTDSDLEAQHDDIADEVATFDDDDDHEHAVAAPDESMHAPRTLGKPARKPRIVWPLTIAILLLAGTGISGFFYLNNAGKNTVPDTTTAAAPAPTAPAADQLAAATPAPPPPAPAAPAPPPLAEPVNAVTMSMLDEGPTLTSIDHVDPAPPAPAVDPQPQPEPQSQADPQPEPPLAPVIVQPSPAVVVESKPVVTPAPPAPVAAAPVEAAAPAPAPAPQPEPAVASSLNPQHVAYLVDASGSLVDTLPQVLAWLDGAIKSIDPKLEYTIIFFRAGQAVEVPPAGLKEGENRDVNRDVRRWFAWDAGNVIPAGRSDPRAAIQQALTYGVGQIYILSDGHVGDRLSDEQIADFMVQLDTAVGSSGLTVHSVQFFYPEMRGLLAHLATRYPGTRQFIEPPEEPKGDAFDGLTAVPN